MSVKPTSSSEKPTCIDCGAPAPEPCAYCKQPVCDAHVQVSRWLARTLFGPYFMPDDVRVCELCYGERLGLSARAMVVLLAGAMTISAALVRVWLAIPAIWVLAGIWWWGVGRYVRQFRARRDGRKTAEQEGPATDS